MQWVLYFICWYIQSYVGPKHECKTSLQLTWHWHILLEREANLYACYYFTVLIKCNCSAAVVTLSGKVWIGVHEEWCMNIGVHEEWYGMNRCAWGVVRCAWGVVRYHIKMFHQGTHWWCSFRNKFLNCATVLSWLDGACHVSVLCETAQVKVSTVHRKRSQKCFDTHHSTSQLHSYRIECVHDIQYIIKDGINSIVYIAHVWMTNHKHKW